MRRKWIQYLFYFVRLNIRSIMYIVDLTILWCYIILNWKKCISMQFFSQFDGNNILFLVGIVLIILPFYKIEGKGVKIKGRGIDIKGPSKKAMEEDLEWSRKKYLEGSLEGSKNLINTEGPIKSDGSEIK